MKSLFGIVAAAACAALTFMLVLSFAYFAGGSECDRAECNAIGEFNDEHQAITLILAAAIGLSAGAIAARAWRGR